MRIELLVVPECPNEPVAAGRLRQVLDEAGLTETPVDVQVVTLDTVADMPTFGGSPTILIDGVDPFMEGVGGQVGLSCRIYQTSDGTEGAPSVEQLRNVLGD